MANSNCRCSPIICYSLSAIRYSLSAIRYSLSAIRYSLFAIRYSLFAIRYSLSAIRYSLFAICFLTACQTPAVLAPGGESPAEVASVAVPGPEQAEPARPEMGVPPGPVLCITPLPDGEFLAGVGPVGDAETGFEWQLYRGRGDDWRRLAWPPEAIPRSLHAITAGERPAAGEVLLAVPFSNALFGRGQAWGLMRSTDGGQTWRQALTGLGDPYIVDLALSPASPDAGERSLLLVTWYHGVYRSTDAGQTWEPLSSAGDVIQPSGGANPYDLAVAVSPDYSASTGEGLVLASFSHGLHRWRPGDERWQTIPLTVTATLEDFEPPEAQLAAGAIAFSPEFGADGTLYLYSGYAGLFRSADRGETWRRVDRRLPLPPPFITEFHMAVASAEQAYVLLDTDQSDSWLERPVRVLYRTLDGGRSWDALAEPPTLGWVSAFALGRDPQGRVMLHLGGSLGGVSSHLADTLSWD